MYWYPWKWGDWRRTWEIAQETSHPAQTATLRALDPSTSSPSPLLLADAHRLLVHLLCKQGPRQKGMEASLKPLTCSDRHILRCSLLAPWQLLVSEITGQPGCCLCAPSVASFMSSFCSSTDCSPPGSSVHGILQARILEWVAMPSSRGSPQPRDRTLVS